jgi:hypothetical protein
MSRSGYTDDYDDDPLQLGRWRGRVKSAIRGRRGQQFLRDTLAALDAMPEKRLITEELRDDENEVCTLGAVLVAKGVDPSKFDPEDHDGLGKALDIAPCLVQEIEYLNDDEYSPVTPEKRWERMRREVERLIKR